MRHVGLQKPTSFLDEVSLGCTRREGKTEQKLPDEHRKMFQSTVSDPEKSSAIAIAWSYDMEGHAKKIRGAALRIGKQKHRTAISVPMLAQAIWLKW